MSAGTGQGGSSRRGFLKGVGAAGAGLMAGSIGAGPAAADPVPGALAPRRYARIPGGAPASSVDFGRIFPSLPPFAEATDRVRAALIEVGGPGGIMDAGDQLSAGPKALIVDPTVNGNPTATNPYGHQPGQPDDDRRARRSSGSSPITTSRSIRPRKLGVPQNPLVSPNTRTPALDLDSVFGGGPGGGPDLYVEQPGRVGWARS